jgi:uncharacterized membrane protein
VKRSFARWRANFFTGLAVVLPAVVSIAVLVWVYGFVAGITDTLLLLLPPSWTRQRGGEGPVYWYWSLLAFLLAIMLVGAIGRLARYYIGRKLIQWFDLSLSRVPLLNKVYATVKQIKEVFSSNQKSSFKQVVLIEYPRPGIYSLGFLTGEEHTELEAKLGRKVVSVFIPTTPNPTSGFLLIVPEDQVRRLDMSVADVIKYVVSLGALPPERVPKDGLPAVPAPVSLPESAKVE